MSLAAVEMYTDGLEACKTHLGLNGGEDFFTMKCLDSLGVGHMKDHSLLNDKYTAQTEWHFFDVSNCMDDSAVAFHPFKTEALWMTCHGLAHGFAQLEVLPCCDPAVLGTVCKNC